MRLTGAILMGAVLLSAGTACGERTEPTGALRVEYPLTVRGAGEQSLTIQQPPRRVAAVAAGPARILSRLRAEVEVAGPSTTLDANGRIRIQPLRRARPDLIVASPFTDAVNLAQARRAAPAPVYFAPENSIRDVERAATELGLLLDAPLAARRVVGGIERIRQKVAERLRGKQPVQVFIDTGFFTTVSTRSLIGDLVREAGGRNVAGRHPEAGPFSLRRLRQANPDVYLATSDSETTLRSLRSDPRTRGLKAVKQGRVAIVPAGLLEPGPSIGVGLQTIARELHPDAFR
jgi:iron complex transport system substrate-binding protein